MTVSTQTVSTLEKLRTAVLTGRHAEAVAAVSDDAKLPAMSLYWYALALIGVQRSQDAELIAFRALTLGYVAAVPLLACAQRMCNANVNWLQSWPVEAMGLSGFELAFAYKEIGNAFFRDAQPECAALQYERVIDLARRVPSASALVPAASQALAQLRRDAGLDWAALECAQVGLHVALAERRSPLLIEAATAAVHIGDVQLAQTLLEELETCLPTTERGAHLLALWATLKGNLEHAEGRLEAALGWYDEAIFHAQGVEGDAGVYAAFYAALVQVERCERWCGEDDALQPFPSADTYLFLGRELLQPGDLRGQRYLDFASRVIVDGHELESRDMTLASSHVGLYCPRERGIDTMLRANARLSGGGLLNRADLRSLEETFLFVGSGIYRLVLRSLPRLLEFIGALPDNDPLVVGLIQVVSTPSLEYRDGRLWRFGLPHPLPSSPVGQKLVSLLLERGAMDLDAIIKELFPEKSRSAARNHFHQIKYVLAREWNVHLVHGNDECYRLSVDTCLAKI